MCYRMTPLPAGESMCSEKSILAGLMSMAQITCKTVLPVAEPIRFSVLGGYQAELQHVAHDGAENIVHTGTRCFFSKHMIQYPYTCEVR